MNEGPWRVQVSGPAARDIEQLPHKYATAIVEMLSTLAENPKRLGKPLRFELEGRWSARRGPYRVIYTIDEGTQTVTVLGVAHRANAYRRHDPRSGSEIATVGKFAVGRFEIRQVDLVALTTRGSL